MKTDVASRKKRLKELEGKVREGMESYIETGMALREIRDERLYEDVGFSTWKGYLEGRVGSEFGIERAHAQKMIQYAEIRPKLPSLPMVSSSRRSPGEWSQIAVLEFSRLVPDAEKGPGTSKFKKDYAALRKVDARRVAKDAIKRAGDGPVTQKHVRAAVDADLGVDRAKAAAATKKKRAEKPDLARYIKDNTGVVEGIAIRLESVDGDAWTQLEESHPGLVESFATACDELAALLRS
jgi:hypothetical protein